MTKETKHTPGPWKVTKFTTAGRVIEDRERIITIVKSHRILRLRKEDYYNAFLIATAPELLTACVYALNELKHPHPNPENKQITIDYLQTAISKAESGGVKDENF